ncbi:hypothetical protein MCP1_880002 [Candidatus Terasakiella magnetica]|nr:hypothetical protein MCP1_880002 [Candidatus Terasakiella magnetica]
MPISFVLEGLIGRTIVWPIHPDLQTTNYDDADSPRGFYQRMVSDHPGHAAQLFVVAPTSPS